MPCQNPSHAVERTLSQRHSGRWGGFVILLNSSSPQIVLEMHSFQPALVLTDLLAIFK